MRAATLILGLASAAALPCQAQVMTDPALMVETVAGGLASPTSMAFLGPGDILVLQKNDGRVRRVVNGVVQAGAVLDVAVHSLSERGLLGIALDPDFTLNRHVYLYYTESATGADTSLSTSNPLGNRVYRYTWNGSLLVDPVLVLDLPATTGPNHNGGVIAFGPDGALYAVIGDLNRNGKLENFPFGAAPDDSGVILRVDRGGQAIPGNPFFNAARPTDPMGRYFAYGIRNSFGLAFDLLTGSLWDTENGPAAYDEVNRVVPGFNSGWVQIMGPDARDPQGVGDLWVAPGSLYRDPDFSWAVPVAPTAPLFVRGPQLGCGLQHSLLVADNNCGQIYRFRLNAARDGLLFADPLLQDRVADNTGCAGEMNEILFGGGFGAGLTDLENGPDGRVYVVSYGRGTIYRIGPKPGALPDRDGDGAPDDCDCAPGDAAAFAVPGEVRRLSVAESAGTRIDWDSLAPVAGAGTTYDLVTGDAAALRRDGGFASACTLRARMAAPPVTDALGAPLPGSAVHYLLRAANLCGSGTFGSGTSVPDPRDPLDAALPPPCLCAERTGGALITFGIVDESLTVWITDSTFIDRALEQLAGGTRRIPIFGTLLDGRACDPQWTWQVDPANVLFADAAIELCDGLPSHIEADKAYWLGTVKSYCPWSAVVRSVDDRRSP
jgi:glucose/arabinose dehydrogenase